jgi:hypothetical protein
MPGEVTVAGLIRLPLCLMRVNRILLRLQQHDPKKIAQAGRSTCLVYDRDLLRIM